MPFRITVEEATTRFIELAIEQGIDPASLNRNIIAANFTAVFARKTQERETTPEQIAARFAEHITRHPEDLDDLIARGEV